jgi:hypothetical protein
MRRLQFITHPANSSGSPITRVPLDNLLLQMDLLLYEDIEYRHGEGTSYLHLSGAGRPGDEGRNGSERPMFNAASGLAALRGGAPRLEGGSWIPPNCDGP